MVDYSPASSYLRPSPKGSTMLYGSPSAAFPSDRKGSAASTITPAKYHAPARSGSPDIVEVLRNPPCPPTEDNSVVQPSDNLASSTASDSAANQAPAVPAGEATVQPSTATSSGPNATQDSAVVFNASKAVGGGPKKNKSHLLRSALALFKLDSKGSSHPRLPQGTQYRIFIPETPATSLLPRCTMQYDQPKQFTFLWAMTDQANIHHNPVTLGMISRDFDWKGKLVSDAAVTLDDMLALKGLEGKRRPGRVGPKMLKLRVELRAYKRISAGSWDDKRSVFVMQIDGFVLGKEWMGLVMPALPDNLEARLRRAYKYRVTKEEVRTYSGYWCTYLTHAVAFLHDNGIIHRDIHPKNILVDHNNTLRLAGFSLAYTSPAHISDRKLKQGTAYTHRPLLFSGYTAPETILGGYVELYHSERNDPEEQDLKLAKYGTAADMFSLGAVFADIIRVSCDKPLRGLFPDRQVYKMFVEADESTRLDILGEYVVPGDYTLGLLKGLLHPCPKERLGIQDLKKHPFFNITLGTGKQVYHDINGKHLSDAPFFNLIEDPSKAVTTAKNSIYNPDYPLPYDLDAPPNKTKIVSVPAPASSDDSESDDISRDFESWGWINPAGRWGTRTRPAESPSTPLPCKDNSNTVRTPRPTLPKLQTQPIPIRLPSTSSSCEESPQTSSSLSSESPSEEGHSVKVPAKHKIFDLVRPIKLLQRPIQIRSARPSDAPPQRMSTSSEEFSSTTLKDTSSSECGTPSSEEGPAAAAAAAGQFPAEPGLQHRVDSVVRPEHCNNRRSRPSFPARDADLFID